MSTHINWSKLVAQNRVKAPGINWTKEEEHAIYELGMSPEDVRIGFLKPEDLEKFNIENKGKETPLRYLNKAELIEKAKELNLEFDDEEVTRGDLILLIEDKLKDPKDNPELSSPSSDK